MAELYDELRGDYRAEQARRLAIRYGWVAALILLLALAGGAAWFYRQHQAARADAAAASALLAAMQLADAPGGPHPDVLPSLQAIGSPAIYRVLAELRAAAIRQQTGEPKAAIVDWDQVSTDNAAPLLLRQLASLLSVQHQIDTGEPNALIARLGGIETAASPWRPLAEETQALIELHAGRQPQAVELLHKLQTDPQAPDGVRGRARALSEALGAEPAEGLLDAASRQER